MPHDYYRLAAEQGLALAKHNLALLYEEGRGVEQDYAQALTLYREAAEAGEIDAAVNLGVMYLDGVGTAVDNAEALKWTELAADEQQRRRARTISATSTSRALASRRTSRRRAQYYQLAADQGYQLAVDNLERLDAAAARRSRDAARSVPRPARSTTSDRYSWTGLLAAARGDHRRRGGDAVRGREELAVDEEEHGRRR